MKITVIVPTGEVRIPKADEWFWSPVINNWKMTEEDFAAVHRSIGKAHEIEVPDDTELIRINRVYDVKPDSLHEYTLLAIPLPRKKKVKKWQWLIRDTNGKLMLTQAHYGNQNEVEHLLGVACVYEKVSRSEIEVEE